MCSASGFIGRCSLKFLFLHRIWIEMEFRDNFLHVIHLICQQRWFVWRQYFILCILGVNLWIYCNFRETRVHKIWIFILFFVCGCIKNICGSSDSKCVHENFVNLIIIYEEFNKSNRETFYARYPKKTASNCDCLEVKTSNFHVPRLRKWKIFVLLVHEQLLCFSHFYQSKQGFLIFTSILKWNIILIGETRGWKMIGQSI